MTGVYILILDKKAVYVGATENWPNRMAQHKEITFNEARLIECHKSVLLSNELRLIRFLKPLHNRRGVVLTKRKPILEWVSKNLDEIKLRFEQGSENVISARAKLELGYSPKTHQSDIEYALLRNYQKITGFEFNRNRRKFIKVKV